MMTLFKIDISSWMIYVSPIVSGISAFIAYINYRNLIKWKRTTKELEMAKSLYDDFLTKRIPKIFSEYSESKDWIIQGVKLSKEMKSFKNNIRYFRYSHQTIYNKVNQSLEKIDDLIVEGTKVDQDDIDGRKKIIDKISIELNQIYRQFIIELPDDLVEKNFIN